MEENKRYKGKWEAGVDYPTWMLERSLVTLEGGYLLADETPREAMYRVARRAGEVLKMPEIVEHIFQAIWKGWIAPSSPVWSNFGTSKGLPISCFSINIGDSISHIYKGVGEIAKMSQLGGGTAAYAGNLRGRGSKIASSGGVSNGTKSFAQSFDTTINTVTQGKTRRGAMAWYLPFSHPDFDEHVQIKTVGDPIQNLFPAVCMDKSDYEDIYAGDEIALKKWSAILESRNATGLPYIYNTFNANHHESTPPWYGHDTDYKLEHSNLCTEIFLPTSLEESFVCCLVSMNVEKWDEWKDTKAVRGAIYLLEAIMQDFIDKTEGIEEMEKARKFAMQHRALGLGILGWHSLLQSKDQPFAGLQANMYTNQIMSSIKEKAIRASEKLAYKFGNCPVVEKYNAKHGTEYLRRHTTLLAIAPTTSNATICGGVSPGVEPLISNYFVLGGAKGNFTVRNPYLEKKLKAMGKDTLEVWNSIRDNDGSVQHLDFLSEEDKETFLTFGEINQFELVKQAAMRQKYIDQGQSLNVKIRPDTDPKLVSSLYLMGQELGIKSFYYQRSESLVRQGISAMDPEACSSCSG